MHALVRLLHASFAAPSVLHTRVHVADRPPHDAHVAEDADWLQAAPHVSKIRRQLVPWPAKEHTLFSTASIPPQVMHIDALGSASHEFTHADDAGAHHCPADGSAHM